MNRPPVAQTIRPARVSQPENAPPAFHLLSKPTGAICNLDCAYCFFLDKAAFYPGSKFHMSDDVLEQYIRQLIESHQTDSVNIAWQGGEPTLMGLDFYRRAIALVEKYRRPGMRFLHTLQTNGTLLDDEHNGDLYSCDHFVEPAYLLGNIQDRHLIELVASPQQIKFGQDKRDTLPRTCLECDVRFACHGECPKNRFVLTPDGEGAPGGEDGLNYLCAGFKTFFHHVDFPMKIMAGLLRRGHEASEVMAVLELAFAGVQRNDPCPCGSGRKFKRCHGAAPVLPEGKKLPASVARSTIPTNPASITPPAGSNA